MPTVSGHTSAIRAKQVLGTKVTDPSGNKIGSIDELTQNDGMGFRDRTYDYYKAPRYWELTR